ncbi:hypothetical protein [Lactococcus lactis]|uniref:hypothetical protein n=1 Tax=Lactococcus lactis TaxID=1358 RepID=UPI001F59E91A|nr:hypothetical protein [Lactococcus lactis]
MIKERQNQEIFDVPIHQKRLEVTLKSLNLGFEINPEGKLEKTKKLLDKLGDSTMLTVFEESKKVKINLLKLEQEASQKIRLENTEWDLLNPLDSGKCVKDLNDKLFGFMRLVNKKNRKEVWLAYEQVEYAPYILAPVGEFFLLNRSVVIEILNLGLELEFQKLIQFDGEYLEIRANKELVEENK